MPRVNCGYCGRPAVRRTGEDVYPHRPDLYHLRFFVCDPCDARVGCHPDGSPRGRLANAELRKLRMEAHAAFDPFWKSGKMSRSQAYKKLAQDLGIPERAAHVGDSSMGLCLQIIHVCKKWREQEA